MQYRRKKHHEVFSILGIFFAGILFIWGIYIFLNWSLTSWGGWVLIILGLLMISYELYAFQNRVSLRNEVILEFEDNPSASLDDIAQNTGISRDNLRDIVLDLRGSGKMRGLFSTESGHFETFPVKEAQNIRNKYCPRCGASTTQTSVYCAYCGSRLMRD